MNTENELEQLRNGKPLSEMPTMVNGYTLLDISQVIYAKVTDEELRILRVGVKDEIVIGKSDALFKFYKEQFDKSKSQMITGIKQ